MSLFEPDQELFAQHLEPGDIPPELLEPLPGEPMVIEHPVPPGWPFSHWPKDEEPLAPAREPEDDSPLRSQGAGPGEVLG